MQTLYARISHSLAVINITVSCYVDDGSLYLCRICVTFRFWFFLNFFCFCVL